MNPRFSSPSPEDSLARAEAALRQTAVSPGPSEALDARTLAALGAADGRHEVILRRRKTMRVILSAAAAVLAAAGGLCYFGGVQPGGTSLAFADVAQRLHDAHTLAYQMTAQAPQMKEAMRMQVFLKEPGWIRLEGPGGVVSIARTEAGKLKTLALDPTSKTALVLEGKLPDRRLDGMTDNPMQFVEQLRNLVEKQSQPAGKKKFGAVQALGFRVQEGQQEWLVWADPETRLPVRVEFQMTPDTRLTFDDFRFNPELKDALFHLDVPDGYKLQPLQVENVTPEEALVRLLRAYATAAGGRFPPRVDDWAAYGKQFREAAGNKTTAIPSPEVMRDLANVGHAGVFLQEVLKGRYGYRSKGVKLGDAGTILFWYRPANATKYRALCGDLHWADVTTDQLPEVPKP